MTTQEKVALLLTDPTMSYREMSFRTGVTLQRVSQIAREKGIDGWKRKPSVIRFPIKRFWRQMYNHLYAQGIYHCRGVCRQWTCERLTGGRCASCNRIHVKRNKR